MSKRWGGVTEPASLKGVGIPPQPAGVAAIKTNHNDGMKHHSEIKITVFKGPFMTYNSIVYVRLLTNVMVGWW